MKQLTGWIAALALLFAAFTPQAGLAQPTVDGDLSDAEYTKLAQADSANGFGPNDVRALYYYIDETNQNLYIATAGTLETQEAFGTLNRHGIWINVKGGSSSPTGKSAGTALGVPGASSDHDTYLTASNDQFTADFEVDFMTSVGPTFNAPASEVDALIGDHTDSTASLVRFSRTDQSGSARRDSAGLGIEYAYVNRDSDSTGAEWKIPFSAIGASSSSSIEVFAFLVNAGGFFSNEVIPGDGTKLGGNPGTNPDWDSLATQYNEIWHITLGAERGNSAPVAESDNYSVPEEQTLNVSAPGVLNNDSDPDGDPLTASLLSDVSDGSLTLNANGSFTYTPDSSFTGTDSFTYEAIDDSSAADTASVTIDVKSVGPILVDGQTTDSEYTELATSTAAPDSAFSGEGLRSLRAHVGPDSLYVAVEGKAGLDDNFRDIILMVNTGSLDGIPRGGALVGSDEGLSPLSNLGGMKLDMEADYGVRFTGSSKANCQSVGVDDHCGFTSFADYVNLQSSRAPDFADIAVPEDGTPVDSSIGGDRSFGANVAYDDTSSISSVAGTGWEVAVDLDSLGVRSGDAFQFFAFYGNMEENQVSATLLPADGATESPWSNSEDWTAVPGLQATDGLGGGANDVPTANADQFAVLKDSSLTVSAPGVLANDTDPDLDALSASLASGVSDGTLTLNADGSFTYTPDTGFTGTDSFTYEVTDDSSATDQATVSLEVQTQTTRTLALVNGWNLPSIPLDVSNPSLGSVLPSCESGFAFEARQGYVPFASGEPVPPGVGFFANCSADSVDVTGLRPDTATADVRRGWNIIGPAADTVAVSDVGSDPSGIVASSFYSFSKTQGYQTADSLQPGRGYWVQAGQSGTLGFSGTTSSAAPALLAKTDDQVPAKQVRLTVTDAQGRSTTLHLAPTLSEQQMKRHALPPKPPSGLFDVRFTTGRSAATFEKEDNDAFRAVELQGAAYPIELRLRGASAGQAVQFRRESGAAQTLTTESPSATLQKTNDPLQLNLESVPTTFALKKSYPNPASGPVTIEYGVPEATQVSIEVYDVLGRRVARLVDGQKKAGSYTTQIEASRLSSGTYFYRMRAGDFQQTRRMVIVE